MPRPPRKDPRAPRSPTRSQSSAPGVVRTIEVDGSSPQGWDAAVSDAIATAKRKEGADAVAFEVVRLSGEVAARRVRRYRVTLRVAYMQPLVGP